MPRETILRAALFLLLPWTGRSLDSEGQASIFKRRTTELEEESTELGSVESGLQSSLFFRKLRDLDTAYWEYGIAYNLPDMMCLRKMDNSKGKEAQVTGGSVQGK